jgi:hypothetical protein
VAATLLRDSGEGAVDSGALGGHTVVEVYKGRWRRLRLSENSHGGEEHNNMAREIFALSTEKKWGWEGGGGSGACGDRGAASALRRRAGTGD